MPTYGYECKSCRHSFDVFQSMKDEPVKICPKCGKEVRRLINGGTGIIFKGGGFYVTDKASRSAGKRDGGEAKSGTANEAAKTAGAGSPCAGCPKAGGEAGPVCPKASGQ